jgi:hypothetical protein
MRTYERLIEAREIGDGDSDPGLWKSRGEQVPDRVILLGLDIKMFYGGPKEAVMHAIYRQNYGFTDIIGRKQLTHAHDGSVIWGDFAAQEIFEQLNGDLLTAAGRVRCLLSVGRPRRFDGQPQGRKAGVHLGQGRSLDAPPRRKGGSAHHAREHLSDLGGSDGREVGSAAGRPQA